MANRSPVASGILIALAVIGIVLFLLFLAKIGTIVLIILVSTVLATSIAPLVESMMKWKLPPKGWSLPRSVAILLVYLGLIIVVGAISLFIGTVVVREAIQLGRNAPSYFNIVRGEFVELQQRYTFLPDLAEIVQKLREQIGVISSYSYRAVSGLVGFLGNLIVVITVFILTYYILVGQKPIKQGFLQLIPPSSREEYESVFSEMGMRMGGWLRGQLLLALIIGILISLVLWAIGVPYPFIIGLIGAIAEIVPMVGPAIAAIPAVLLVLFQPAWQIIAVIVFFALLSQFEANYLGPKIMQQQVGLNPLITIVALLVGATLAGVIGALLAIPLAAAVQVFVQRIVLPAIESAEKKD